MGNSVSDAIPLASLSDFLFKLFRMHTEQSEQGKLKMFSDSTVLAFFCVCVVRFSDKYFK